MWWVVVHGQKSVLSALDTEWEKVQLQTTWSLEQCFMGSSVTLSQYGTGNVSPLPITSISDSNGKESSDTQESSADQH